MQRPVPKVQSRRHGVDIAFQDVGCAGGVPGGAPGYAPPGHVTRRERGRRGLASGLVESFMTPILMENYSPRHNSIR